MMRKPTETANLSLWELRNSGLTGSQHGTDLGLLHLGGSCVAWSFVGHLGVGQRPVPDARSGSLEPIPFGEISCPSLMQGERSLS